MSTHPVGRLLARLREMEQIAIAASSDRDGTTPDGEHWRWECTTCDRTIPITPVTMLAEHLECPVCGYSPVALRSVENYSWNGHALSHFVVGGTDEMRPVDALFLQMHDPAHVLRAVQAARRIIDRHKPTTYLPPGSSESETCRHCDEFALCPDVRDLISIYLPEDVEK